MLPFLYEQCGEIDIVTCYGGAPATFRHDSGRVFQISAYAGPDVRDRLTYELNTRGLSAIGIVCAAVPIMTKWKWMLAARVPAKLFVINENGDLFWADYSNWRIITYFILFRAGLSGADAVATISRLLLFPFTVIFLVAYATVVHARRWLRRAVRAW